MSTLFLPIDFDSVNYPEKLHLVARMAIKLGINRKVLLFVGKDLNEEELHYLMNCYDDLKEEAKRNRERNERRRLAGKLNQKVKKTARAYERLATIPLKEVFENMGKTLEIGYIRVSVKSKRYRCYHRKGVKCVKCGIEANYFAVERQVTQPTDKYHLNLYHLREDGKEVMMTVDHIIPKSRGGPDKVSNLQPMCSTCNGEKGNRTEEELENGVSHIEAQRRGEREKSEKSEKSFLTPNTECDMV